MKAGIRGGGVEFFGVALTLLVLTALTGCNAGQCEYNGDCTGGMVCVAKVCVAPAGADHCPAGQPACMANEECTSAKCEGGCCKLPCESVSDCDVNEVCTNGACTAMAVDTGCHKNADCAAPTPFCITATNTCAECRSTSDCGLSSHKTCFPETHVCAYSAGACGDDSDCTGTPSIPKCDTYQHLCVGCLAASDCAVGETCSEMQTCVAAPPEHCTQESECTGNLQGLVHCAVDKNLCVRCAANSQCPSSQICRANACVPNTGCQDDNGCNFSSSGPYCNVDTGVCVGCLETSQCTAGLACVNHVCGHCTADPDCAQSSNGHACRLDTGVCTQCNVAEDCSRAGATCNANHQCVGGACSIDEECANSPSGSYCVAGACAGCRTADQCTFGLSCFHNQCAVPTCASDDDCSTAISGPHCDLNDHRCYPCALDSQCPRTLVCDLAHHQCSLLNCNTDPDCAGDATAQHCDSQLKICVECAANSDCPTGQQCIAGTCGDNSSCGQNSDCGTTALCVPIPVNNYSAWTDRCVAPQSGSAGGAPCGTNANCASRQCYHVEGNTTDGICLDACVAGTTGACSTVGTCPANGVTVVLPGPDGVLQSGPTSDDVSSVIHTCFSATCASDRDCTTKGFNNGPRICGLTPNPTDSAGQAAANCLPLTGYVQGGMPCFDNSDCQSNICVAWTDSSMRTTGRCFGACTDPARVASECAVIQHATPICADVDVKVGSATLRRKSCIFHP